MEGALAGWVGPEQEPEKRRRRSERPSGLPAPPPAGPGMASPELPGGCPAASLLALAEMLGGAPEEEEEEGGGPRASPSPSVSRVGPGSLGPPKAPFPAAVAHHGEHKGIWTMEEVPEELEYEDSWDTREQPEYEILFKQQMGAEDVFLGMSRKDPSTACCEDMLIKIKLPDTKASDITLDICEKVLDLRSPQKKLLLHLPHPVDSQSGKACFLSEQGLLEVTLRMKRELDFLNFA